MIKKAFEIKNTEEIFSERLKKLVDQYGSQQKFTDDFNKYLLENQITEKGTVLSTTTASVSNYINGKGMPSSMLFKSLADFLFVSYDYLFGHSDATDRENYDTCKKLGLNEQAINNIEEYKKYPSGLGVLYTDFINMFLSDPMFMCLGETDEDGNDSFMESFWKAMIQIRRAKEYAECFKDHIEPLPDIKEENKTKTIPQKGQTLNNILSDAEKEYVHISWENSLKENIIKNYKHQIDDMVSQLVSMISDYFKDLLYKFIKNISDEKYDGMLPKTEYRIGLDINQCEIELATLKDIEKQIERKKKRSKEQ